ncbi:flagellar motor protein MotB [Nocardioides sp. TF02-7]|uniref:OmpA/MotB family protein n=1 Tax=Nocardioides sp. TF02-7 TaxID=2917724 RepID=UPI001F05B83B|nr:flagellar motor protein MotB [Nocardioides sp. TF02-7]UMG92967.1 OmpA family protein [Nocardioides sp. TF02-7]
MARRRRDDQDEEHTDERWLVTYADMVTLLMVLFIVMFAMSNVDERKYQDLKSSLADGFGRSTSILNGASPTLDERGPTEPSAPTYDRLLEQLTTSEQRLVAEYVADRDRLRQQRAHAGAADDVERLLAVRRKIDRALRAAGLRGDVRTTIDERGLVVSLVSRHVVFQPDVARLTDRGRRVVDAVAPVLAELTEPIQVDGHTNQEPVRPRYFPTDWELSAARAVHVLRRLNEVNGLPADRLRATGYGHTRPLVDPDRPGSQRINKRVDLVVLSQGPAATRARIAAAHEEETS